MSKKNAVPSTRNLKISQDKGYACVYSKAQLRQREKLARNRRNPFDNPMEDKQAGGAKEVREKCQAMPQYAAKKCGWKRETC